MPRFRFKVTGVAALGLRAQPHQSRTSHGVLFLLTLISLTIFVWALGGAVASYLGQDHRGALRSPIIAEGSGATSNIAFIQDRLSGLSLQFTVAYIIPLDTSATPPPGLPTWPEPGEVYLSPALRHAGKAEGIETRYGTFVGEISADGLTTASELFAYVNPGDRSTLTDRFQPVSHFGSAKPTLTGSLLDRPPISYPLGSIVFILGLPLFLLVRSVIKMGLHRRRQETTILEGLAAKKTELLWWHGGKICVPLIVWLGITAISLAALCVFGLSLPGGEFHIAATDFRAALLPLALSSIFVCALFVATWLTRSLRSLDTAESTRPALVAETYDKHRARIGMLATPLAIVVAVIAADQNNLVAFLLFIALSAAVAITIPDTLGLLLVTSAKALRRSASRRANPEVLVAAAVAESRSTALTRITVICTFTIVLAVVTQTIMGIFAMADPVARVTYAQFKNSVLTLSLPEDMSATHIVNLVDAVTSAQPAQAMLVADVVNTNTNEAEVRLAIADPENAWIHDNTMATEYIAMRQINIGGEPATPPDVRSVDDVLREREEMRSSHADASPIDWQLIFVANVPGTLDIPALKETAFHSIAPMPYMEMPEESWIVSQTQSMNRIGWIELLLIYAIATVALSLIVFTTDERNDGLTRLAKMREISGRPIRTGRISFVRTGLPIGIGIAAGALLATIFSVSLLLLYGEGISLFTRTIPAIFITVTALFCVLWFVTQKNLQNLMKGSR